MIVLWISYSVSLRSSRFLSESVGGAQKHEGEKNEKKKQEGEATPSRFFFRSFRLRTFSPMLSERKRLLRRLLFCMIHFISSDWRKVLIFFCGHCVNNHTDDACMCIYSVDQCRYRSPSKLLFCTGFLRCKNMGSMSCCMPDGYIMMVMYNVCVVSVYK